MKRRGAAREPMEIFIHDDGFPDGDGDDLRNNKSQRKQINSNMRDARNLSIAGRGGEEKVTREYNGTDKEGYILRCRGYIENLQRSMH